MVVYPKGLPLPLREGYDFTPVSPLVRTTMASGQAMQRRRFRSVPTEASVSWVMSAPQAALFQAWYEEAITSGADWFECPIKTPLGLDYHRAQFKDIYRGPTLVGVNHWRFTATLVLFKLPVFEPGWATVLPAYILESDIFDKAVNQKWPAA